MSELRPLNYLELEGYKTFRSLPKFALRSGLNVLIGANGSGKTNLIRFFEMLGVMMDPNLSLQNYLPWQGGANGLLFRGLQVTQEMRARLWFNLNEYRFTLRAGPQGVLFFSDENVHFDGPQYGPRDYPQGQGHVESALPKKQGKTSAEQWAVDTLSNWRVFHFHNTAPLAPVMQPVNMVDNERLRGDAGNLAAFLWRMRETRRDYYDRIVAHIRLAAPYFGEFDFREVAPGQTQLLWKERYSDSVYYPFQLSDGSVRFICLAALLLQPEPPSTIILDEPELGLHPFAINVLAGMLALAAERCQLIVSTQSSPLVDYLQVEDLIVVDRVNGESTLNRLDADALKSWLEDYTLGELWDKNVLGGRPQL